MQVMRSETGRRVGLAVVDLVMPESTGGSWASRSVANGRESGYYISQGTPATSWPDACCSTPRYPSCKSRFHPTSWWSWCRNSSSCGRRGPMTERRALLSSFLPLMLLSATGSTSQCVIITDSSTGSLFISGTVVYVAKADGCWRLDDGEGRHYELLPDQAPAELLRQECYLPSLD